MITNGQTVTYEAAVTKARKKSEIVVAADGSVGDCLDGGTH